jgi:hypothetical protein
MSPRGGTPVTLGDVLAARRRRRFVGRVAELELFRAALSDPDNELSVLHLHGPGGIGKTSLLDVLADIAAGADAVVVRLDGRELVAAPRTVLAALRERVDVPDGAGPIQARGGRLVLLVDAYERLEPIDGWFRTSLLTRLPADTLAVLAGRAAPAPNWRADPAWRDLLRVVSLRNLDQQECRDYLTVCDVDDAMHERVIQLTHGHPLGLSLVADVVVRGGDVAAKGLGPDLVGELLRSFVDAVPDARQRAALRVSAIARVTTEALLRASVEGEPAELFAWLRGLSFVETGSEGVLPHDLARDVLDADLRWRDPDGYVRAFHRVTDHIHEHLRSLDAGEQLRAISDLKFLFRKVPGVLTPVDWDTWGQHHPEPAKPSDRDAILGLIAAWEGDEAATIAARWWERQSAGFSVLRGVDDAVRGVVALLDLTAATEQERAADPAAQAAWGHAHAAAPPRPGEVVGMARFVVDRDAYQAPSPTLNTVPIVTLQRQLATPHVAWDYLLLHEPDALDDFFALAELHRVVDADVDIAGRRYGMYAHDYRQMPVDDLVRLWGERALAQDPTLRPAPTVPVLVLSQAEFADAARQALRDLHRRELLARNPLLRTRVVRDRRPEVDAGTLDSLVREAVATLADHPRDDRLLRAVERTYLDPAPTQEAAAARLGLPFSTYRRHLTQGVDRVVAWLWDREVYGPAPGGRRG